MRFIQRPPVPVLAPFVRSYMFYEGDPRAHALERILPNGAPQVIVNLAEDRTRLYDAENVDRCETMPGTVLCGAYTRFCVIDTVEQQRVVGISFHAGGSYPFFRAPASVVANQHVTIEALWGERAAARLRERVLDAAGDPHAVFDVLESALLESCGSAPERHRCVAYALNAFERAPETTSIAQVTATIGLSPKRFIERFKLEVGMTPKAYCRVRRFQRALGAAHAGRQVDWSQVATSCGYFDQAHFIHDFRAFSGITPTLYRTLQTQYQNHVKFLQANDSSL